MTPLQRKDPLGALTVEDVAKDRLQFDHNRPIINENGLNYKKIAKEFTSGDSKKELHRCRLRACLYQDEKGTFKVAESISETIKDTKDKVIIKSNFHAKASLLHRYFLCLFKTRITR